MDLKNQSIISLILQCSKDSPKPLLEPKEEIELSIWSIGHMAQIRQKMAKNKRAAVTSMLTQNAQLV